MILNILSTNPILLEKLIEKLFNKKIKHKLDMEINPKNKTNEFFIFCLDNSGTESLCLIRVVNIVIIAERKIKAITIRTYKVF